MKRLAIALFGAATLLVVAADAVLIVLPRDIPAPDVYGVRGMGPVLAVVLTALGGAIAVRQPRNSVGWIFLLSGLFAGVLETATEYGSYALIERRGSLPGGEWAIWLMQVALCIALGPITTYVMLVFPDGRLPSPRWRPVAWYTVAALLVWLVASTLLYTTVGYGVTVPNPALLGPGIALDTLGRNLASVVLVGPPAFLCVAAFIWRFRRARGVERLQLKWVAYGAAILGVGVAVLPFAFGRKPLEIAQQVTTLAWPATAGLAVLRYRLYDIDLLIKRTLVYGSLSVALGVVYVVTVLVSQQALRGFTGGSDVAVAGSTLLVVALFQPIRSRMQEIVDRRFYRGRYDAARAIEAFSVRLRSEVELDSVRADLIGVVHDTIHPAHASVWLRGTPR
jgi:branched-subunit amino acid transport protein